MQTNTLKQQLFIATVRVLITSHRERTEVVTQDEFGTAFVVQVPIRDDIAHFLVTARHVVEHSIGGSLFFLQYDPSSKPLRLTPYEFHRESNFQDLWFFNENASVDVACAPLDPYGPIFDELKQKKVQLHGLPVGTGMALTRANLDNNWSAIRELDALEEVIFVGYPTGHFDRHSGLPIVRRGFSASWLQIPFEGMPMFLVDAAVWPGSSGSPVFCLHEKLVLRKDAETASDSIGTFKTEEQLFFLGMLTDILPSKLDRTTNINLGAVFNADAVFDTVHQ
jgi:hypothetical protein